MTLIIKMDKAGAIRAGDQSTKDILARGFFGKKEKGALLLEPEEAMYLMDIRNAECRKGREAVAFNNVAGTYGGTEKMMARYFTYKDWRDRGLIARRPGRSARKEGNRMPFKRYPAKAQNIAQRGLKGVFFPTDMTTVVDDSAKGRKAYESGWFGQYGNYKASDRGTLNKLDIYETVYLMDNGALKVSGFRREAITDLARANRGDFDNLYAVYRDWRDKGYVVKTGFKFGTHFRIYFPGARPIREEGTWVHSKHVIHVFARDARLLVSEWARVIRVAHSVKKTFILAIPGRRKGGGGRVDFILYHRKRGEAETPKTANPRFAMLSLGEEEKIGGSDISDAIREAAGRGLELVIAIADRETSVTYYKARRIRLPGSSYEYYEIDWMQP